MKGGQKLFKVGFTLVDSRSFFERLWELNTENEGMEKFGRRIRRSARTLHYWKTGEKSPTLNEVIRLSKQFGVNEAW